jgi:hypothetical protein
MLKKYLNITQPEICFLKLLILVVKLLFVHQDFKTRILKEIFK